MAPPNQIKKMSHALECNIIHWAEVGDLQAVRYCREQLGVKNMVEAMDYASENGHLAIVQYFHSIKARCSHGAMNGASKNGHLAVVQFLHSIGAGCTSDAMDGASRYGHLAVVQFLHSIGAPVTKHAMARASLNGHLEVVQFLHSIGAPFILADVMDWARSGGHWAVVDFLKTQN
jgi:hypothetical protein